MFSTILVYPSREAQWQSRKDARGQLLRIDSPLLGRIAREERVVQFATDEAQALVLEAHRCRDRLVGLGLHERLGLLGREVGAEEVVDERQVEGHAVDLALHRGAHRVAVRHHLPEAADVVPHVFVCGVEDVRSVDVHHHPG
ncbi:MAG: hypothetical protein RIS71_1492 [Actinomycetota bacterium]